MRWWIGILGYSGKSKTRTVWDTERSLSRSCESRRTSKKWKMSYDNYIRKD